MTADNSGSQRKPLAYRDLHLRFGGYAGTDNAGTFKVWVEGDAPGGAMRPDDASQCSFDAARFWANPDEGSGGLVGRLERRKLTEPEMCRLGTLLGDLALPEGPVRTLFARSLIRLGAGQGLRIRLHIDAAPLLRLPWEYILLPEVSGSPQPTDFLVLRRDVSLVRADTVEAPIRELPDRDHVEIVGVLSSPDDQPQLDLDKDRDYLESSVRGLNEAVGREVIRLRWCGQPATREALAETLADGADIFHFAGHGRFSRLTNTGFILLETADEQTDNYPSEALAQLMRDAKTRLAVLGACESGRRGGGDVWSGMAAALTRQRIPAVIGNQFTINDHHAGLIAANVYRMLFAGFSIDEALAEVRRAVFQQSGLADRDWGVPVLYLSDPTGVLFAPWSPDRLQAAAGPFVRVSNSFGRVLGKVVDVDISDMSSGRVEVSDNVDVVEQGGEFTSIHIDNLG